MQCCNLSSQCDMSNSNPARPLSTVSGVMYSEADAFGAGLYSELMRMQESRQACRTHSLSLEHSSAYPEQHSA